MTTPTPDELWKELESVIQEALDDPNNGFGTVPVQYIRTQIPAVYVGAAMAELDRAVRDGRVVHIPDSLGMGSVRFP